MRSFNFFLLLEAAAPLTAGTKTTDNAYGINAGNNNSGMSTPEIIPYKEVAAIAVIPDIESARKKIIGSKNQVNVPNNRLPDEGNAIF